MESRETAWLGLKKSSPKAPGLLVLAELLQRWQSEHSNVCLWALTYRPPIPASSVYMLWSQCCQGGFYSFRVLKCCVHVVLYVNPALFLMQDPYSFVSGVYLFLTTRSPLEIPTIMTCGGVSKFTCFSSSSTYLCRALVSSLYDSQLNLFIELYALLGKCIRREPCWALQLRSQGWQDEWNNEVME